MTSPGGQNIVRQVSGSVPQGPRIDLSAVDATELCDATRDIGVAFQKKAMTMKRSNSWHTQGSEGLTSSDIAQPGGFRRHYISSSQISGQPREHRVTINEQAAILPYVQTDFVSLLIQASDRFNSSTNPDAFSIGSVPSGSFVASEGKTQHATGGEERIHRLVLLLIKGLIGSVVLFLPRMMMNGGLLLAGLTFVSNGIISMVGILLLIECVDAMKERGNQQGVPSYGELAKAAMGNIGLRIVNVSLVLCQLLFLASYFIFIKSNIQQATQILSQCRIILEDLPLICALAVCFVPLTWVRRLRYFAYTNMIGNACMILGLVLILGMIGGGIFANGLPPEPVSWMKLDTYALALGTSATAFEGIGFIVPMYESTGPNLRPHFKSIFSKVMASLIVFMASFGAICYIALRDNTQTIVLLNLPTGGVSAGVQLLYSLAIVCTYPLLFYPVVTIVERALLPASGAQSPYVKWQKNAFRAAVTALCAAVGYGCADNLDNFLAVIGSLCCIPLAIIYPAFLHRRLVGGKPVIDNAMIAIGLGLAIWVFYNALVTWGTDPEPAPDICLG